MALFRRKPKNQNMLPEVEQYYNAGTKDRGGLAWVLALVSIVVIALIIVGVFFAGRWVYHRFNDTDNKPTVSTSDNTTSFDGGDFSGDSNTDNKDDKSADDANKDSKDNSSTSNGTGTSGDQETKPTTNTPTPTTNPNPSTTTPTTPNTGSNSGLPSTGPADTIAIFAAATAIAAGAHALFQKFRSSRV